MKELRILVTGGGTSGHISPAIAIIQTIQEMAERENFSVRFLYLGSAKGLEKDIIAKVADVDLSFVGIQTGKLRRYFSLENIIDQLRLPVGVFQSLRAIARFKPDVVFSTGGYVAVPPVIAASLLKKKILIHEQTVQIGLANRITARFATRIALSFESAREELSSAQKAKAFVTGNPLRPQIFGGDPNAAKVVCYFSPADDALPTVYVTGGSQGSRIINRAVEDVMPELLKTCRVIHQCGRQPEGEEQDFERLQSVVGTLLPELRRRYWVSHFFSEELRHVFALCDLVVGRAGAGTVAELCALKKPAIYIPLVPTGGDEQTRNAQMCERAGAAVIIKQSELTGEKLLETVQALVTEKAKLQAMSAGAATLARPDAARELAREVIALANDQAQ